MRKKDGLHRVSFAVEPWETLSSEVSCDGSSSEASWDTPSGSKSSDVSSCDSRTIPASSTRQDDSEQHGFINSNVVSSLELNNDVFMSDGDDNRSASLHRRKIDDIMIDRSPLFENIWDNTLLSSPFSPNVIEAFVEEGFPGADKVFDTELEFIDLDLIFPDIKQISSSTAVKQSDDDDFECYSFEEYESSCTESTNQTSEADSTESSLVATLNSLLSDEGWSGFRNKELIRANTLPLIPIEKLENIETVNQQCVINTQNDASSIKQERRRRRSGMSADTPTTWTRRASTISDTISSTDTQKLKKALRKRSTSTDRRRGPLVHRLSRENASPAWQYDDDSESTTSSETCMLSTTSSETSNLCNRGTAQLFYTTPPRANMVQQTDSDKRLEGSLSRIARRLSQKDRRRSSSPRQRSISLDCGDGRSVKIVSPDELSIVKQYVTGANMKTSPLGEVSVTKDMNNLSPNNNRFGKNTPSPGRRKGSNASENEQSSPGSGRIDRRKSYGDKRLIYDIQALFEAVEHQDLELVQSILDTEILNINSINEECLTPLDVAVLTNNIPMAKVLLFHGAKENPLFQKEDSRADRLETLVSEAEKRVVDLTAAVLSGTGNSGISSFQQKENERKLSHWEFRHRLLKRMKAGYDHARPPESPTNVHLSVGSSSSLMVRFDEPVNHNGAVITRYRIEWSCYEDFAPLAGEVILDDVHSLDHEITGLISGNRYYVRVSAWNMKGYGTYLVSNPLYAVPSSWRDIEGNRPRSYGKLKILEELFSQVKDCRPPDAPLIKDCNGGDSPVQRKRKSIKNLFTSAPKLQKNLKRGVYLACLLYNEDRILVTSEEQLPIIEVDENFTGPSIYTDFHWMMKIACTWDDVKSLRMDMEKSSIPGAAHMRSKLLHAASLLQNALGIHDLGQFYHRPLRDTTGCTVLTTINYIKDPKHVSLVSGKWLPIGKLQRRLSLPGMELSDAGEMLMNSISEMILYHQVSSIPLTRGLYLGYLKLRSSVDLIRALVPQKTPNALPYTKVRDCPSVSRDEWEWIQSLGDGDQLSHASDAQIEFQEELSQSCQRLLNMLGVPKSQESSHRLYDLEVIELSSSVSFILVLPSCDEVCIVPGQTDLLMERPDYLTLPVQVYEMINMSTYQPEVISRYCRVSCILDTDLYLAQQAQREAFSNEELYYAKDRVEVLSGLQSALDKAWKSMRWIMDLISYGRDRTVKGGVPLNVLYGETSSRHRNNHSDFENNNNSADSVCNTVSCESNQMSIGKDHLKIAKFYDPNEDLLGLSHCSDRNNSNNSSSTSLSSRLLPPISPTGTRASASGILRVYAAYETGLAKGTSVKLHVTPKTTAREVINLVVQQLNKAVCMKGRKGPIYPDEHLQEFCLVAVIGARERILQDEFRPLQLQNPWTKGRLYVRMKTSLLSAFQQGQGTTV